MKNRYEFNYLIHIIQTLFDRQRPSCFSLNDTGSERRLVIDWESAISELWPTPTTQPHEGLLFVAQIILLDPVRWDAHAPLLRAKLAAYQHWLFPLPPSIRASHLDRDVVPGECATSATQFHALRHQLFRFLGGHSLAAAMALRATFEKLMESVLTKSRPRNAPKTFTYLDVAKIALEPGLSATQLRCDFHLPPVERLARTTLAEELAAMLRGERFGAVKDKNYLFVRHAGYAEHLDAVGDTTVFHNSAVEMQPNYTARIEKLAENVRLRLRSEFRCASDLAAGRLFAAHPQLKNLRYNPLDWTVVLRADISASLRENGIDARNRREGTFKPTKGRRARHVVLQLPEHLSAHGQALDVIWRDGGIFVDQETVKGLNLEGVAGLSIREFVAFDEAGHVTRARDCMKTIYVHRAVLERQGLSALAGWLGNAIPTQQVYAKLLKAKPMRTPMATFTRRMDEELLGLWKPYQSKKVWHDFAENYGIRWAEAKRRAEYVAFAVRKRNLLISELGDMVNVERRLGPRGWKKWRATAIKTRAF